MAVQLSLEQKLAIKRRREQEKRKAVYDADNENIEDEPSQPVSFLNDSGYPFVL